MLRYCSSMRISSVPAPYFLLIKSAQARSRVFFHFEFLRIVIADQVGTLHVFPRCLRTSSTGECSLHRSAVYSGALLHRHSMALNSMKTNMAFTITPLASPGWDGFAVHVHEGARGVEILKFQLAQLAAVHRIGKIGTKTLHVEMRDDAAAGFLVGG